MTEREHREGEGEGEKTRESVKLCIIEQSLEVGLKKADALDFYATTQ